jgi:hypothetical protein
MELTKEEREILGHLTKKELKHIKRDEKTVIFPELLILKSIKNYEEILKELKKKL